MPPPETSRKVVEKLLVGNCAGCHPPNQGLDLTAGHVYANLVNVPSREDPSLMRVKPGDPAASYLYLKVTTTRPPRGARMPLGGPPLSNDELTTLRAWIAQGARGKKLVGGSARLRRAGGRRRNWERRYTPL